MFGRMAEFWRRPAHYPDVVDLGNGVHRITHALPWALDHVHCYAIADPDGWTLVDSGLNKTATLTGWREAIDSLGGGHVARLVITHYHPDHLGASGPLVDLFEIPEVVQGREDASQAHWTFGGESDLVEFEHFLRAHGMPEELVTQSLADEEGYDIALAQPTRLGDEGDTIEAGGETWRVLHLPGHADGHIVLLGDRTGRMFAGDVLLDRITPNVGLWSDSRIDDPLGVYLESLGRIEELAPAIAYTGHEATVIDPAARAREIRAHHDIRLDLHTQTLTEEPLTPWEVAQRVWAEEGERGLTYHEQRFALAEALAHLVRLARLGRAEEVASGRWALA
jgi:glyoxylase-like metal-dependent hydrolase (beta-lactamase superfamily II)